MQTTEMKKIENQKGFTLVEIAIVLVIIGLLLGGVLKGQELIQNSKVKSVAQDMENLGAAYYSYQDRIGDYPDTSTDDLFWFELKTEGFVPGALGSSTDSDGPTHAFDGSYNVVTLATVGTTLAAKTYICANNIDVEVASNLDAKYDDGAAATGDWRAVAAAKDAVVADAAAADYTATDVVVGLCKEL